MDREKLTKLFECFDEIKAEQEAKKSDIYVSLNIRACSSDELEHYLFVYDREADVHFIASIKGFDIAPFNKEIETFEDILKELEKEKAVNNG